MESKEEMKKRMAAHLETMEMLECMRVQELGAMTDEEALRQMKLLRVYEKPWIERPDWSGLVEQQAYFHRKRKP